MPLLLILLTFSVLSFSADFKRISIDNLDLEYSAPHGKGTVDKVGIGFSLLKGAYPAEVTKTDNAFVVTSPFVDLTWENPWKFVYDLEHLSTQKTSLKLGQKEHFVKSDFLSVTPDKRGVYKLSNIEAQCKGASEDKEFQIRLMEDCREEMKVTVKKLDIPTDFILYKVMTDFPQIHEEIDLPADDLVLTSKSGNFALSFYMKYVFYAGLRAWGNFHYEDNYNTIVIRVDQIRFGYLNVTNMMMKKLKDMVTSPNVKVEPPYIRVDISRNNESK